MYQVNSIYKVANTLTLISYQLKHPITNLRLQRLCILAHYYWIGFNGRPLFYEEVYARRIGPVVLCLYEKLRPFAGTIVDEYISEEESFESTTEEYQHLYELFELTQDIPTKELSLQVKQEPWVTVYRKPGPRIITQVHIQNQYAHTDGTVHTKELPPFSREN